MLSARRPGPTSRLTATEVRGGQLLPRPDSVVTEEPLEIRLEWPGHAPVSVAVVLRTPGADFDLAAGYLLGDGVLDPSSRPRNVAYCRDRTLAVAQQYNVVTVGLGAPPARHPTPRTSHVSSACGVCGAQTLDDVFTPALDEIAVTERLDPELVTELPERLREQQALFSRTGSIHAAGVFDFAGALVVAREDVGRHNAVDKVLGARLLGTASYGEASILCVSGRAGFDIVSKAVAGRIGAVVAVGGPTNLAVDLAGRAGLTLCGFSRGDRFVVYTRPERLDIG